MNYYFDLGCYDGDTVTEFRNWSKIAFPDKKTWQIFAFDPNPNFWHRWLTLSDFNTKFIEMAAWIRDGTRQFSIENSPTPYGSSLIKSKNTYAKGNKIDVQTTDISRWLKKYKDDFLVVKMDIEGGEFAVLEKMMKDGTDLYCDYLMVEFHPNKTEYTTTDMNLLIEKLEKRGVNLIKWH